MPQVRQASQTAIHLYQWKPQRSRGSVGGHRGCGNAAAAAQCTVVTLRTGSHPATLPPRLVGVPLNGTAAVSRPPLRESTDLLAEAQLTLNMHAGSSS